MMMYGCQKCSRIAGVIILVLGVLFLLKDFNVWGFWGISWWTALFIVGGIVTLAKCSCSDCQAMCGMSTKRK